MTGAVLGVLGGAMIGGSDCVARWTSARVSLGALLLAVMGLSGLAVGATLWWGGALPGWHAYAWSVSAASGLLNLLALGLLYKALARGPVAVASPAAASFAVMLVAINALAGAPATLAQAAAIALVFAGIVMLSRPDASDLGRYDAAHLRVTAAFGLAAAFTVSMRMYLAQEAADALDPWQAVLLNRLFAALGALALIAWELRRRRFRPPAARALGLVVLQSVLETGALAAFLTGSAMGDRVGATIGFATFPAFTAVAAWLFLGDRIGWRRSLWMALVGLGAALTAF